MQYTEELEGSMFLGSSTVSNIDHLTHGSVHHTRLDCCTAKLYMGVSENREP